MKDRKEEFVLARDIKGCAVLVFLLIESETGDGGLGKNERKHVVERGAQRGNNDEPNLGSERDWGERGGY